MDPVAGLDLEINKRLHDETLSPYSGALLLKLIVLCREA